MRWGQLHVCACYLHSTCRLTASQPHPNSFFFFFLLFSDLAVKSKLVLFMATFFTSQCDVSAHSDVTVNSHGEIIRWLHCEEIWGYILRSWWSFFGLAVWCFSSQWCHSKLTWWDHQMTSLWRNMRLHFEVMVKFFWTCGVMFQLTVMSQWNHMVRSLDDFTVKKCEVTFWGHGGISLMSSHFF